MPELAVPSPPAVTAESKPPLPPFTLETAKAKVQAAEAAWDSRNPDQVALAYTVDSEWHNRAEFIQGLEAFPHVNRWIETLKQRPAVQVGMDILQPNFNSNFGTLAVADPTPQLATA